ncbi:MAG: TIR domain-containing protein, partial [Ruminiclostridium sp.]|nr:TIR domain-containing protein [Ruminiclostridium sp.]
MSTLKCKMCGGTLEINENETTATCEYCGTEQTIPKITDDVIGNLFNRANTLRLKSEFDKAEEIYNKIVGLDNTQSEAYWGIILCKYGIEYVEDPTTYKRVPTCHRTSYDAITADEDYKLAIQYADISQKIIYEAEAKAIDEIQKGILTISQNEKPYDVFICYKETDESGKRTQDSVLANDIYHQLTQEGFKVFYAAITLEDKLGQEYEPYIFAALNSAKVMLVIGSKPEYFTAVWVKNEWSRYLKLMKADRSKLLIPCYKDMDAYELPEEFAHLQAQDMGKIGFINDIVRGIKKVINKDEPKSAAKETAAAGQAVNSAVAPLLKRISLFLEDGNWQEADEYCERVLDSDPENAQAYLYKLMAKMEVRKTEDLRNQAQPFDSEDMYRKTVRFAAEELKNTLEEYNAYIKDRNEKKRIESIYKKAVYDMGYARDEISYKIIIEDLAEIPGYKDADEKKKECEEKAEECRLESLYNSALKIQTVQSEDNQLRAAKQFEELGTYKDSAERVQQCRDKAEEIRTEEERIKAEREKAEKERKAKAKKRNRNIAIILPSTTAICVVLALLCVYVIIPAIRYNMAVTAVENKNYDEAIAIFEELGDYSDSADKIPETKYKKAENLVSNKEFDTAIEIFGELGDYNDSADKINETKYNKAMFMSQNGDYDGAIAVFEELGEYSDSADKAKDIYKKQHSFDKKVGHYVSFGKYEQDNNTSNGKEKIEWLVLEVKDGKALVISKYALDCKPYNTSSTNVTWETCSLRNWLNNDFINSAFSATEKTMIPSVKVSADKNPDYSTSSGKATQDRLFLLSVKEMNKYLSSNSKRRC